FMWKEKKYGTGAFRVIWHNDYIPLHPYLRRGVRTLGWGNRKWILGGAERSCNMPEPNLP
ncbi:hypothetical protein ACVGWX_05165, partial [Enterobacter hormaechei]